MFPPTLDPNPPFVDKQGNISFSSGDFHVEEMTLGKLIDDNIDGVQFKDLVDLQDMWATFTLSQSMTAPFMTLNITISEHKRMFERLGTKGMQGEEFVMVNFKTPTRESIQDIFYVSNIERVQSTTHKLGYTMVLRCVSKEKLISDLVTVNRAYEKTISETVKNIFNSDICRHEQYIALGSGNFSGDGVQRKWKKPELYCDDTYGVQKFIVPGLSPFTAMKWLNKRAYGGPNYSGSVYRFFQNSTGYHFANLEKRIENGVKQDKRLADTSGNSAVPTFTFDNQIQEEPRMSVKHFRNIQTLSSLATPDTLRRVSDGTFSSNVRTIDIVRKSFYDSGYELDKEYSNLQKMGNELNVSNEFIKRFGHSPREHLIFKDTLRENEDFEKVMGKKLSYSKFISSFGYNVTVYGDSNLNVGDVIKLDMRESGTTKTKDISMYAGYFLIVNLQHVIDRAKFNTVLTLVKESPDTTHSREN